MREKALAKERKQDVDEMSTSSGAGAFLPGLDVPEKKYKGPYTKEDAPATSGYKKVKGFRPGHTPSHGGFIYKDLWGLNEEEFKEMITRADKDRVERLLDLVKDKDHKLYMQFLGWMAEPYPHDYEEFEKAASGIAEGGLRNLPPRKKLHYTTGEEIVPGDKVESNTKMYGTVNNFSWDDGQNKAVVLVNVTKGGGSSHLRPNVPFFPEVLTLKDKAPAAEPQQDAEALTEGLKTEIKTRTKSQQFKEAIKLANKKISEANNILEYAQDLKREVNETVQSNLMEKMQKSIASAYKKMKNL